ncbi:unnamed protein product [Musa acuminata subsp. malaccensis]|uniref:(wild Malaysian banana) hypothetical protein n=1 Tax=Musa acuminata subsp. malaccensis TaxID=214687 RepID=A0A8D7FMH1_MUSAM|nr:unnamed protein product [Musa acuminata subsp. malaccensis]
MNAAAVLGGAVPVPSFQAARKEWRAVTEHSFRSSGVEKQVCVKSGQSAERTIYEVQEGTSLLDVDPCSVTTEGVGELNDDILQQKLQEITRQRERLQQMEIELRARAIARSDILEVQNSFEGQLKEQIDFNANLKEQLHEREQHILELEMKLEEKDRELHAMKIDTEEAWAKEDLLREQNKELVAFRRERDKSEAERAQLLNQIRDLQEHIQEKENQFFALQEQHRVVQETILFKDEQLREAQAWIARVQEMDALQSSTNQSLQAELRERTEQFNQYWMGSQRQFVEMEHYHMQAIQQLQLELAEARGNNRLFIDGLQVTHENSVDSSSYDGNQINVKDDGKSDTHLGFTSNGSVDRTMPHVSASNSSTKTDPLPSVSVVPSSIISMNALIPPGQMSAMHSYVMDPQSVASTNSPIPQSHMGHFQSMPMVPPHQLWQNHQTASDISQIPNQSKFVTSQTEQDILRPDTHSSSNLLGEIQMVHPDQLNSHTDQQQMSGPPGNDSSEKPQVANKRLLLSGSWIATLMSLSLQACRGSCSIVDSLFMQVEASITADNQSQDQVLESEQRLTSGIMLSASQSSSSISLNGTEESAVSAAPDSSILMPGKPLVEPNLLDERSLLACIVRAVPAGSDGRIRISTTLPNRLGKMLAPLHWHHYKKYHGRLDDFISHYPELFVIEGDFIHLREGAQQIISATAAVAKVAAASASSAPYTSLLHSVAVTPVAQISRQKMAQSIESKVANTMPSAVGAAVTDIGDSSNNCSQILTTQNQQPNGIRVNIIQGLSDVTISSKLKNVQEANGFPSEFQTGHSSFNFSVGSTANLDKTGLSSSQCQGPSNGRHSFGGKQQGRSTGAGLISRR